MQLTIANNFIIGSSRGRTFGFGPENGGSNPSPITIKSWGISSAG
jgi:hypothetical protein